MHPLSTGIKGNKDTFTIMVADNSKKHCGSVSEVGVDKKQINICRGITVKRRTKANSYRVQGLVMNVYSFVNLPQNTKYENRGSLITSLFKYNLNENCKRHNKLIQFKP